MTLKLIELKKFSNYGDSSSRYSTVLELIKVPMYKFHYDYIKIKYGNKSIDSLKHAIETPTVYDLLISV